jgi:methylase of polypeptide subunit release factors
MITAVSEYTKENLDSKNQKWILMDIGTWCGVLWISVLLQNSDSYDQIFFSDLSTGALFVAQKNYENLIEKKYNHEFLQSDLVSFISDKTLDTSKPITLVANLPYIPDETFDENSPDNVQKREPRMAFVWWDDGLDLYRKMFNQLFDFKSEWKIWKMMMFLEMMTRQVEILEKEFWDKLAFEEVKTFHFNIRIVKASFKN